MNEWKYIAGAGIVGFVLSFFSGLIAGVSVLVIFFRSFLSALILAGVFYGILWVVRKFVPELFEVTAEKVDGGEEVSVGGEEVDIVIPEENPHASEGADEATVMEEIVEGETGNADGILDVDINKASGNGTEAEGSNESVKSVDEIESVGDNSIPDEGKGADVDGISSNEDKSSADVGASLDKLPELDGMRLDSIDSDSSVVSDSVASSSGSIKSDVLGTEVDPSTLAKAVRSFMKKDEEG